MQILLALAFALTLPGSLRSDESTHARLLERYQALPPGPEREALEPVVDASAAQRYATVSGLYWYTDLAQAEEAARARGRPILSLRMLGRLDEELSCANSRYFRVALYANASVSQFLRENFVLHWSSERPVPKVTIDFGDGRAIHTTLAGNSAHYVLDSDGRVIDVLPGLYSPVAFQRELEALLPLARRSPALDDANREQLVKEFLAAHDKGIAALWSVAGQPVQPAALPGIVSAEFRALSKAVGESSLLAPILPGALDSRRGTFRGLPVPRRDEARLDEQSRALFERLVGENVPEAERLQQLANFELSLAADTYLNEVQMRRWIHAQILGRPGLPGFEELNARIYDEVFLTPRTDPWLGLLVPGVFNGLPNGGISR